MSIKRIGIYPGTFNPVHVGHLEFARQAAIDTKLDKVYFLPEKQPRGKHNIPPQRQRASAIDAIIHGSPNLTSLIVDVDQFSVDSTLDLLEQQFSDCQLVLLIGTDVALTLASWNKIDKLVDTVEFAIGLRDSENKTDVVRILEDLEAKYRLIKTMHSTIRSSQFRTQKPKPRPNCQG